jgi:hypothetical protein
MTPWTRRLAAQHRAWEARQRILWWVTATATVGLVVGLAWLVVRRWGGS